MQRILSIFNLRTTPTFGVFAWVIILSGWLSAAFESFYPLVIPAFAILVYFSIVDFRNIFFFLLACIPLSTEFYFPNGYGTDLPTEPLTIGLMIVYWLFALKNGVILRGGAFFRHPITLLILLHFGWILVTTINSENVFLSIKFLLAKTWYIVTFYFLAGLILQKQKDFKTFFWCIAIPLSIALVVTLFRQYGQGFSFKDVNKVMNPFFRNHVTYGCITVLFLPYIFLARSWQKRGSSIKLFLTGTIILFLLAIQFSYVRAAYVGIFGALGYYLVVRFQLTRYVLGFVAVAGIVFIAYMVQGNNYLNFTPNFEKTITHERFDNLLDATAKGEDVSTMERVYRWVAGFRMIEAKPFMGFGPNNFYSFYKSYTLTGFKTYVSDNPEQSTIHCYYLLMAVEQGIPGALIFLGLVGFALMRGERVYHQVRDWRRGVIMAVMASFVIILFLLLINDLVETDKFGSFFFMSLAALTNLDISTREGIE
jgi:O-antigen ligase